MDGEPLRLTLNTVQLVWSTRYSSERGESTANDTTFTLKMTCAASSTADGAIMCPAYMFVTEPHTPVPPMVVTVEVARSMRRSVQSAVSKKNSIAVVDMAMTRMPARLALVAATPSAVELPPPAYVWSMPVVIEIRRMRPKRLSPMNTSPEAGSTASIVGNMSRCDVAGSGPSPSKPGRPHTPASVVTIAPLATSMRRTTAGSRSA